MFKVDLMFNVLNIQL